MNTPKMAQNGSEIAREKLRNDFDMTISPWDSAIFVMYHHHVVHCILKTDFFQQILKLSKMLSVVSRVCLT